MRTAMGRRTLGALVAAALLLGGCDVDFESVLDDARARSNSDAAVIDASVDGALPDAAMSDAAVLDGGVDGAVMALDAAQ